MRRIALATLCLFLGSCAPAPVTPGWGGDGTVAGGPYPFAPVSMRIFPLTRLDADSAGKPMIICHIEFRDAWGDSAKAVGRLEVSMSGSVTPQGGSRQDLPPLAWNIDLADLDRNAKLYDRATRTYRIQLVDLPANLGAVPVPGEDASGWRINLRATLSSTADGPPTLQDEYTLQP
jgi:hypothetical protein